ncbi:hypothetical protein SAMN04487912_106297 [Arthrobacter sp. cf158]|uniref:hypothetical protein n=1 Tax=Arthrobacter sp. cf158 TaxID=1761744 RepID=UPI00089A5C42|nr:hypothetical protein [Arthrobacter sp. cf158]SDX03299.1 hypothetical protein SAMN04487912_106297 [Arthrobacter sp. cf158]
MFRRFRVSSVTSRQVRAAGVWIVAALAVTLRPGAAAAQDYRAAVASTELDADPTSDAGKSRVARRTATALLLAAAGASEVYSGPGARHAPWLRRAALGVFLETRAADARSLPGRWPYDTFIEAVLLTTQLSGLPNRQPASLPLSISRVALYLPYTQAGLSKIIHGFDAWVRRGDANHIYHLHLKASGSHPFAQDRFAQPVRAMTRLIPFLEFLALPLALVLPGKFRIVLPCCSTIFHIVIARTWNISFWQAPLMQWLMLSLEKQPDLAIILRASRGN